MYIKEDIIMKNRINLTISNTDLKILDKVAEIRNISRSELVSELVVMEMYKLIDDDLISFDELKEYLK